MAPARRSSARPPRSGPTRRSSMREASAASTSTRRTSVFSGIAITNGNGGLTGGGAIAVNLTATGFVLSDSTIFGNVGSVGGGVEVYGSALIERSTFTGNSAVDQGWWHPRQRHRRSRQQHVHRQLRRAWRRDRDLGARGRARSRTPRSSTTRRSAASAAASIATAVPSSSPVPCSPPPALPPRPDPTARTDPS